VLPTPEPPPRTASNAPAPLLSSASTPSSNHIVYGRLVRYGGLNIAGFEFGCGIGGDCNIGGNDDVSVSGTNQMQHFVNDLGLNAFRLPVGWQYLVNNQLGGPLHVGNFAKYDVLVQGCLRSGADLCIIDV
jgi:endoglucanase